MNCRMGAAHGWLETVLVVAPPGPTVAAIVMAAAQMGLHIEPVACLEDLVALPAYLVVADPGMFVDDDWSEWCRWLREADDRGQYVLLIGPERQRPGIPETNLRALPRSFGPLDLMQFMAMLRNEAANRHAEFVMSDLLDLDRGARGAA